MTPASRSLNEAKPAGSSVGRSDSIDMLSEPPRFTSAACAPATVIRTSAASAVAARAIKISLPVVASDRAIAQHGDAEAGPRMRPVVPHGAVLRAAIVPERH